MPKDYEPWYIDEDYVVLYSIAELEALDCYLHPHEYDFAADPVAAICGEYIVEKMMPCSLPDHTLHKDGWVGLTQAGFRVAIGGICGRNHVPDMDAMIALASHGKQFREYRNKIADTLKRAPDIRARLQRLRDQDFGGAWLERNQARIRVIHIAVRKDLEERAKQGNLVIYRHEGLSDEEKDDLKAMGTGASIRGRRVEVGRLAGLGAIKRGFKDEALQIHDRLSEIERGFDPKKGHRIYRSWSMWCGEFDRLLDRLEELILEGQRFFEKKNIDLVSQYIATTNRGKSDIGRVRFELYKPPEGDPERRSGSEAA